MRVQIGNLFRFPVPQYIPCRFSNSTAPKFPSTLFWSISIYFLSSSALLVHFLSHSFRRFSPPLALDSCSSALLLTSTFVFYHRSFVFCIDELFFSVTRLSLVLKFRIFHYVLPRCNQFSFEISRVYLSE